MVLGSISSVQCGAALATTLFGRVGPAGAVFLRGAFAALILLAVAHRDVVRLRRSDLRDIALFGVTLAAMNLCFYAAIERLPLGIAVTFEFSRAAGGGDLRLAPAPRPDLGGARRARHRAAVRGLRRRLDRPPRRRPGARPRAPSGPPTSCSSARVGGRSEGLGGLAMAMAISAVLLAPVGDRGRRRRDGSASVLARGLAVGVLSSAFPYALEIEALRRLPNAVFGVMMSLEPAVAALVGFIALGQGLDWIEAVAIALVVAASAGALRSASTPAPRDVVEELTLRGGGAGADVVEAGAADAAREDQVGRRLDDAARVAAPRGVSLG